MKDGFVKVACATPCIKVADTDYNSEKIASLIDEAEELGIKLLILPELCVTGYTSGDLFLQKRLLTGAEEAVGNLAKKSMGVDMVIIIGAPVSYYSKLFNVAIVMYNGRILGVVPKTHIPNYSEFYEKRYFSDGSNESGEIKIAGQSAPFGTNLIFRAENIRNFAIGVEICEDLWVNSPPSSQHALNGAYVIANLSASDEFIGKEQYRRSLVKSQSGRCAGAYIYADAGEGESSTDMVFAGHNIIAENGAVLKESELFSTGLTVTEIDLMRLESERNRISSYKATYNSGYRYISFDMPETETKLTRTFPSKPFVPSTVGERSDRSDLILKLQAQGLKTRIAHTNSKCVVVGVSGGLDSCLALLVSVKAMQLLGRPASDVLAVTMPGFGTTGKTLNNARKLIESLGAEYMEIDITKAVKQHFNDIGQDPNLYDVTYENSQARERTQILMDLSNKRGGFVIGTGDLSELALGFATYNGDHMSMYAVNSSVPKTLIRHIVKYSADNSPEELKTVLYDILNTPVSPELLPADGGNMTQITEDIVGPYELHDFFLYYTVRWGFNPAKVYRLACHTLKDYKAEVILKWLKIFYKRFFAQQFKRSCLPDGPKVGTVTLSPRGDWRMPSDASAALWLKELEEI
jgi:NAD+ synthase (glutamine-hydrolysing)